MAEDGAHNEDVLNAGSASVGQPAEGDGETAASPPTARSEAHFRAAIRALEKVEALSASGQWSGLRQAGFLAALADGDTVAEAAERVSVSVRSAYSFRKRAEGECFDLGWRAAGLLARENLHDILIDRAFNGQVWTVTRDDGERVVETKRRRFDNRLALAMLARLDKQADGGASPELRAAHLIAGDFDNFLARLALPGAKQAVVDFIRARDAEPPFNYAPPADAADALAA